MYIFNTWIISEWWSNKHYLSAHLGDTGVLVLEFLGDGQHLLHPVLYALDAQHCHVSAMNNIKKILEFFYFRKKMGFVLPRKRPTKVIKFSCHFWFSWYAAPSCIWTFQKMKKICMKSIRKNLNIFISGEKNRFFLEKDAKTKNETKI